LSACTDFNGQTAKEAQIYQEKSGSAPQQNKKVPGSVFTDTVAMTILRED
jgi:hypothetical protein